MIQRCKKLIIRIVSLRRPSRSYCDFRWHTVTSTTVLLDVFGSTAVSTLVTSPSSLDALKFFASSSFEGSTAAGFSPSGVVAASGGATFEVDERLPGFPFTRYLSGTDSVLPLLKREHFVRFNQIDISVQTRGQRKDESGKIHLYDSRRLSFRFAIDFEEN